MPGFDTCHRCGADVKQDPTPDLHANFAGVAPALKLCKTCRWNFRGWLHGTTRPLDSTQVVVADGGDMLIHSDEIEEATDEFEQEVADRFDVDPEDIEVTAEQDPGADRDIVSLTARWVVS